MYTKTWKFGTDQELDQLFESLREKQHQDHSHPLWRNYYPTAFYECEAVSINFVNNQPFFCSSILKRDCWPENTYRILNRLWKPAVRPLIISRLSPGLGSMLHSQLEWLRDNTDFKLAFVSRETDRWQKFFIENFENYFNLKFKMDNYKYLTCSNPNDKSCWQKIIYYGDDNILTQWTRNEY